MAGTPKRRARKLDELEAAVLSAAATAAKLVPARYIKTADGRYLSPNDFDDDDIGRWWNELLRYIEGAAQAVEIVVEDFHLKADPQADESENEPPTPAKSAGTGRTPMRATRPKSTNCLV